MKQTVKIGVIGDYDAGATSHPATNAALEHAADLLSVKTEITWLPSESFLTPEGRENLRNYDAFWASGGTYLSTEGVLAAIRTARETGKPFIGT